MALDPELLEELTAHVRWVDGGPLHEWEPVHSRFAKPIWTGVGRPQIVLNRSPEPPTDPAVQRWVDHQTSIVPQTSAPGGPLLFWRVAVRQRAIAIGARPHRDPAVAVATIGGLIDRAATLKVVLGFVTGSPVPVWVARDEQRVVFMGLPEHHLVPTTDPSRSVAALLSSARIKPQVRTPEE